MLRTLTSKVAWVGRTASMVFGLALVLALVFGALSVAAAHTGSAGLFHLNHNNNVSNALTKLTGNLTGAVLTVDNNGTGPALSLQVGTNRPPMTVSSRGKVVNFNADRLDNLNSSALGVTTVSSGSQQTGDCDANINSPNFCAPVTVKVPAGKQYHVTVFSSFAAASGNSTNLTYCPHIDGATFEPGCSAATSRDISLAANYAESGATQGGFVLQPDTYTISTMLIPDAALTSDPTLTAKTTVLVRDASAPGPPID